MSNSKLPRIIVIVGPTASGKSALAMELAQRYGGEIVSADSRAIYRGMNIGSAKPSIDDQRLVAHHLLDIAEPNETITLSDFKDRALTAIRDIASRGKLPILVGGTALYIYAIIDNWQIPEVAPNPAVRAKLEQQSTEQLWRQLLDQDPEATAFVDPHNKRRIIRALEVIAVTGQKFSSQRTAGPALFESLIIGLNPDPTELRQRIEQRTQAMLTSGLIAEVQALIARGDTTTLPSLSGIHYKEVVDYLEGRLTYDQLVEQVNTHDYQLTRRQLTWFKRDARIHWLTNKKEESLAPLIEIFLKTM